MYEKVYVASGAELNIAEKVGGNTQIKSVAGAGTINVGDISGLESLDVVFDGNGNASCVEFDSQVSFADAVKVSITVQDSALINEGTYAVLEAGALTNVDLSKWTVEKPDDTRLHYSLLAGETTISVKVTKAGTLLLIR
jgi:hypothetical protein